MRKRYFKKSDSIIDDILDDKNPKPIREKTKYIKKNIHISDEEWSDDERDYSQHPSESKEKLVDVKPKQKLKKLFHGSIKVESKSIARDLKDSSGDDCDNDNDKKGDDVKQENYQFEIPLPYVSPHVIDILGIKVIKLIWKEFLLHECDETELLLTEYLPEIAENINQLVGTPLPFDKIQFPDGDNEYTDFTFIITALSKLLNQPGVVKIKEPDRILLPPCCANQACQLHKRIQKKYDTGNEIRSNFRLDVIFRRMIVEKHGVVRVKHIPDLLSEADIPYSLDNLPLNYMTIHGDRLITDYEVLFETVELLRGDSNENKDELDKVYSLPKWLQNEFTSNEILLFRHHFMMIDIDCGGTIDKHELQLLGESLGNTITEEEAMKIIAEHDSDGEGSLNFEEFMTLMFQILHGTIDMQNDVLAQTMMESRNQIKIFEEIETIKSFQPPLVTLPDPSVTSTSLNSHSNTSISSTFTLSFVKVLHYGGVPVICEYLLKGPMNSSYGNGKFVIKVIYSNGYPFECPTVTIVTRILHLNFLPLISGSYSIPHLEAIWDSSWSTRELLEHIYELLQCPNPRLLPDDMIQVYNQYITEHYEVTDETMYITSVFQQTRQRDSTRNEDKEGEAEGEEGKDGEEGQDDEEEIPPIQNQTKKSYLDSLKRMSRMAQFHMNLILKFFVDNDNYEEMVRQAVDLYARKKEYDTEEDSDHEDEGGGHGGDEEDNDNENTIPEDNEDYYHEEETVGTNEYSQDDLKYDLDEGEGEGEVEGEVEERYDDDFESK